jgi:hypothetical protein
LNQENAAVGGRDTDSERGAGDSAIIDNMAASDNADSFMDTWVILQSNLISKNSSAVDHILSLDFILFPCQQILEYYSLHFTIFIFDKIDELCSIEGVCRDERGRHA